MKLRIIYVCYLIVILAFGFTFKTGMDIAHAVEAHYDDVFRTVEEAGL